MGVLGYIRGYGISLSSPFPSLSFPLNSIDSSQKTQLVGTAMSIGITAINQRSDPHPFANQTLKQSLLLPSQDSLASEPPQGLTSSPATLKTAMSRYPQHLTPSVATRTGTEPVNPRAAIPCRTPSTGLAMAGAAKAMEGFSQEAHTTTGSARSQGTRRSVRNAESGRVGRSKAARIASPCQTTWRLGAPTPFTGCGISRAILDQRSQTMLKSVTPPPVCLIDFFF